MGRQGIELPHWDMFKRRLWRTPGRWAIVQGLFWLAVTLWFPGEWLNTLPFPGMRWRWGGLQDAILAAIGLFGFALLYFTITRSLEQLAGTDHGGGWYSAPLPTLSALAGVFASTLANSTVTLAGLFAFIPVQLTRTSEYSFAAPWVQQMGGDIFSILVFSSMFFLRLPVYALIAGLYVLAFRQISWRKILPALLSTAALCSILMPGRGLYYERLDWAVEPFTLLGDSQWQVPVIALTGFVALMFCGLHAAKQSGLSWSHVALLIPAILMILLGITSLSDCFYGTQLLCNYSFSHFLDYRPLQPLHAWLTLLFPNADAVWCTPPNFNNAPYCCAYGIVIATPLAWSLVILQYVTCIAIGGFTLNACLNAARYPALPWRKLLSR